MKSTFIGLVMLLAVATNVLGYYMSGQGRWPNRDPLGEKGGLNNYCLNSNETIAKNDQLGLADNGNEAGPQLTFFGELSYVGDCGAFIYRSTWSLDRDASTADPSLGGLIVQFVDATFDVTLCDDNNTAYPFHSPSRVHPEDWPFYEAWSIPPGKSRPFPGFHDFWQMSSFGVGSQGSITIQGTADYFDGETIPWYFSVGNAGPPNNGLPTSSTFTPPGAPSSTVTRTLTATWNCCCNSPSRRTIVTAATGRYSQ
jgi:hypothetical protein